MKKIKEFFKNFVPALILISMAYTVLVLTLIFVLPKAKAELGASIDGDYTLKGVYVLRDTNTPSWMEDGGDTKFSGIHHDFVLLVNPLVKGDKVYPREGILGSMEEGWFLFAEQLEKVDDSIYKIKPDAVVWKSSLGPIVHDLSEEGGLYPYLWDPKVGTGGERVYLNNDVLALSDNTGDNYWIRREDLILINPSL